MRAVRVVGYHRNLELTEVPKPEITGPHDVIVKIGGAGVCRTDLHIVEGIWRPHMDPTGCELLPMIMGHENAGWIEEVGKEVEGLKVGDPVIVHPKISGGTCLACRRGVQVTLLVPQRSNHRLADWARERALRALAAAGAQIWLAPAMLHAKAVLIDEDFALSGSLNLDARSLFLNYEAMTAFYGADDLRWLYRWCDVQIARAMPYQARKVGWARDVAEGVVRTVGFQL